MSREPSHAEMTTPIELGDLPHDVLVSMNKHSAEAMARMVSRDMEAGVYQMKTVADAVEAFRRLVEVSPLAHPHLTEASLALGKARDALNAYASAYGVGSTDAMPVK